MDHTVAYNNVCAAIETNVGRPYCRAEMYAGRVACCPLVSDPKIL